MIHSFSSRTVNFRQRRADTVNRDGSPNFRFTFGAIAATANQVVVMQTDFPASRRYEPLDSLLITNNSAADLDLEINGRNHSFIPAGVIHAVTEQAIWAFRLTNNDSVAAAAGTVRANIERPARTQDKVARGL